MKLHEYQAKELLKRYGVLTPQGQVALEAEEAVNVAERLGGSVVIKAQVHAGGRGKGGGIKIAANKEEVRKHTKSILGMNLVTAQTGPEGQKVNRVLIEKVCEINREFYLGLTLDCMSSRLNLIASSAGGMEIEQVAAVSPEKIIKEIIDPAVGLAPFQSRRIAFALGLDNTLITPFIGLCHALYRAYVENDASLIEINPLVITKEQGLSALDAKINIDDNALYRHKDIEEWRDVSQENPFELQAKQHNLNYVSLDGNVGCMVNGAGLAMATMDLIKLHGGKPSNFLDVGGSARKENVAEAFKIVSGDSKVKAILINIFGGIMRCDVIAEGVVSAAEKEKVEVPIVVRLEGTNVEQGREMLKKSQMNIISADDLNEAAKKAVELAG
jgi:succinyl-CoA synthetase beta subunit